MLRPVISAHSPLGLGSASPRRKALLETLGIPLVVIPVDADERQRSGELADAYLERVTRDKFERVAKVADAAKTSVLLVADTVVLSHGEILGKPVHDEDAVRMLGLLSGCFHEVRTRFAVGTSSRDAHGPVLLHAESVTTVVEFRDLSAEEIRRYVASGEGRDKAGAYAVQGLGSFAVRSLRGSYANVVGLPVCEVVQTLQRFRFLSTFP